MNKDRLRYISRMDQTENKTINMKQEHSKLGYYVSETDPFRISQIVGRKLMIIFYSGILAGILCTILGIVLSVIPGTSEEDLIKNVLQDANIKWIQDNKSSLMQDFKVQVDLLEKNSELFKQEKDLKNSPKNSDQKYNPLIQRSIMHLKDISTFSQKQNTLPRGFYVLPIFSPHTTHFESKIDLTSESVIPDESLCLKIKITDSQGKIQHYKGMQSCGNHKNSIPINFVEKKMLKFSDMIKMNLCSNDDDCEKVCAQNHGVSNAILRKNQHFNHSLEKNYEIAKQTCTAVYAIKELCLLFTLNTQSGQIDQYVGGCYEGNNALYDFDQNVKETSVIIRDKDDPTLAVIQLSSNYAPYSMKQTPNEKLSILFYCIGAGIFSFLILILVIIRIRETLNSNSTQISKVSEIQPQLTDISIS